jgi:Spy/CpxP family protein refolding chaperone
MKFKALLLVTLAAFILPSISSAKPGDHDGEGGPGKDGKRHPGEMFQKIDTNEDGVLSLEELQNSKAKRLAEHFDEIDGDSDGQITKEEMKVHHEAMKAIHGDRRGKGGDAKPAGEKI